jgi:hypothetical protein
MSDSEGVDEFEEELEDDQIPDDDEVADDGDGFEIEEEEDEGLEEELEGEEEEGAPGKNLQHPLRRRLPQTQCTTMLQFFLDLTFYCRI